MNQRERNIAALLQAARRAAKAGQPLRYSAAGFRDWRRNLSPVHAFGTVAAAQRRGLVTITGEGHRRQVFITASGLDALAAFKRDMPAWPKIWKAPAAPAAAPNPMPVSTTSTEPAGG